MCGRYTLTLKGRLFDHDELDEVAIQWKGFTPRYNIAPGQNATVIRLGDGGLAAASLRWGLIPSWAKDPKIAWQCVNARSETVASKPAFRSAFRKRRCLVPADGFYEWQLVGAAKQPWRFARPSGGLLGFAGLWESWIDARDQTSVETFTLCTTTPNAVTSPIHDRMPVILSPEAAMAWLDPSKSPESLSALLVPAPDDLLTRYPVSTLVNNARNDVPECVNPSEILNELPLLP